MEGKQSEYSLRDWLILGGKFGLLIILAIIIAIFTRPNMVGDVDEDVVTELPTELKDTCLNDLVRSKQGNVGDIGDIETTEHFVKGQLIVVGEQGPIDDYFLDFEETFGIDVELVVDCDPSKITGRIKDASDIDEEHENSRLLMVPGNEGPYVIRLYRFEDFEGDESRVDEIVKAMNGQGASFFAEPNYLLGHLANSYCGSPHGAEGSSLGIAGSPHGAEGSPHGAEGSGGGIKLGVPADHFERQWAFEATGLNAVKEGENPPTGKGVTVAVFDTLPYVPGGAMTNEMLPTLTLQMARPSLYMTYTQHISASATMRDHGLFVSSLVHAVAPDSEIHLIEVLNDYGCGNLGVLNMALIEYIAYKVAAHGSLEGSLDNIVFNLSLGITSPDDDPVPDSLRIIMDWINELGGVVVAAAGNQRENGEVLPAQYPARFPKVIGVSASNSGGDLACFANFGDIAAPGGDAGSVTDCEKTIHECRPIDGDDEHSCLVGLASSSPTSYAYWRGSSFATPLVSGTVALMLQDDRIAEANVQPQLHITPFAESDTEELVGPGTPMPTLTPLDIQDALNVESTP